MATWIDMAATLLIVVLCGLVGIGLTRLIAPRIERATAALEKLAVKGPDGGAAGIGERRDRAVGRCA